MSDLLKRVLQDLPGSDRAIDVIPESGLVAHKLSSTIISRHGVCQGLRNSIFGDRIIMIGTMKRK